MKSGQEEAREVRASFSVSVGSQKETTERQDVNRRIRESSETKLRTLLDADALVDHALGESGLALLVGDSANIAENLSSSKGSGSARVKHQTRLSAGAPRGFGAGDRQRGQPR